MVRLNLLFLCGGRRVRLLGHFRSSLNERGGGRIVTTDTEARPATASVADRTFRAAPCREGERFALEVSRLCEEEAVSAVVPLTCAAVAVVPTLRRFTGTPIVSGDEEAVRISTDKRETAAHFRRRGLRTPAIVDDPTASDFPLFGRPRFSEGSRGAMRIDSTEALEIARRLDDYVLTPYLDGTEFSMDCYKDLQGRLVTVIPRERVRVRAGEVEQSVTRRIPELIEATRAALEPLSFVGPATVQAIRADGKAYFTEINLRYGGGVTLSITAGADSPRWLVAELADGNPPVAADVRWNLGMSRYDEDVYFSMDEGREPPTQG